MPAKINNFKDIITAKYDAYKDLFAVELNNSRRFYLKKALGNKITFFKSRDVYQVFNDENNKTSFFKVVKESEKFALLIRQKVKLYGGEKPKSSYEGYVKPYFKKVKEVYYFSMDKSNAVKIPSNKKKFYMLFSDKSEKIKKYAKKNKLNIKKDKDLIKILSYYTSL